MTHHWLRLARLRVVVKEEVVCAHDVLDDLLPRVRRRGLSERLRVSVCE